jgi:hypothetical protein
MPATRIEIVEIGRLELRYGSWPRFLFVQMRESVSLVLAKSDNVQAPSHPLCGSFTSPGEIIVTRGYEQITNFELVGKVGHEIRLKFYSTKELVFLSADPTLML